ncbi:MAG: ABC transporter ATP-binding protein [Rhodobacteraceae bacterium]|nr:ABC transporter ATP-binding protein [Paracoccaceae bacterium]
MSDIRFTNAHKKFGDVEVIHNLNLHVEDGEFIVLVGPSGCAKSTTLRMIAGLERMTGGDLHNGGKRANSMTAAERNISMVFQSYALFPNMSVRQNLSFGLKLRKTRATVVDHEVARVAGMLGLDSLLDRKPGQLSGGQAQRVALGRAMIRRPDAFLFDEPLSNLDAELRVQMRGEISEMQANLSTTTVYVTHDQVEAMTMGDRIAVMNKGEILQIGAPADLYERPANTFVAGFIGSPRMNLMPARDLLADAEPTDGPAHGAAVTVGVRPEHILVNSEAEGTRIGDAHVLRIENLGHEAHLHVRTLRGIKLNVRTDGEVHHRIAQGARVSLTVRPGMLHTFHSSTGECLA